jgi:hypothetical protein
MSDVVLGRSKAVEVRGIGGEFVYQILAVTPIRYLGERKIKFQWRPSYYSISKIYQPITA